MPVTCVVGMQWGDEGKGKIVDLLAEKANYVARYQGGGNAGHTLWVPTIAHPEGEKFVLHNIPSGVMHPRVKNVCANGMVLELSDTITELADLTRRGVDCANVFFSERAHIILPTHKALEAATGVGKRIGTTGRGIGPCYRDAVGRTGVRLADLADRKKGTELLQQILNDHNGLLLWYHADDEDPVGEVLVGETIAALFSQYELLKDRVRNTQAMLQEAVNNNLEVLLEGAQGAMLDNVFGTYPYVTSSRTGPDGASGGTGIQVRKINHVLGVIKAYTTRVGEGPLPTELLGEEGKKLREVGAEYGATTRRARRCGWLDLVEARYAGGFVGPDALAVTKLDVLDPEEKIFFCEEYEKDGKRTTEFPLDCAGWKPVYQRVEGWQTPTSNCRTWDALPSQAQAYIRMIEEKLQVPVKIISVGANRDQTIFRESA